MSKGLRSWVRANWVDVANRRSDGSYPKCGRSKGEKRRNYPKCLPMSKVTEGRTKNRTCSAGSGCWPGQLGQPKFF